MRAFAHWYVVVEILGALVLPLAWRLFRHLPDRGYCFGKILAILLVGYAFWTGTAYGLLRNELGGAVLAVLIVTVASGVAGWRMLRGTQAGRRPLVEGMRRLTPVILTTEALFLLAFGGWAVVRSWGPEEVFDALPAPMGELRTANSGRPRGRPVTLSGPRGLAIDATDNLLVADTGNKRILRVSPNGQLLQVVGGAGELRGASPSRSVSPSAGPMRAFTSPIPGTRGFRSSIATWNRWRNGRCRAGRAAVSSTSPMWSWTRGT
jgi:hypothetical protein